MKNKIIQRNIKLRAFTDDLIDKRQAEFIISSEAIDSYRTVFKINGWQLDEYTRNPIVTYNHSLHSVDPDAILGTSEVFIDGEELIGRVTFEDADLNPTAEKIFKKIQKGTLKMASVGAQPLEWRMGSKDKGEDPDVLYFTKQTLVEWSIVPAGSNPDAHKRNAQCIEEIRTEIKKPAEKDPYKSRNKTGVIEALILINK